MTPALILWQSGNFADPAALTVALASCLFVLGAANAMFRRDALFRVMGVVLVLAAAALNFVAASGAKGVHGHAFAIFLAVECAALAIIAAALLAARSRAGRDGR